MTYKKQLEKQKDIVEEESKRLKALHIVYHIAIANKYDILSQLETLLEEQEERSKSAIEELATLKKNCPHERRWTHPHNGDEMCEDCGRGI